MSSGAEPYSEIIKETDSFEEAIESCDSCGICYSVIRMYQLVGEIKE